MAESCDGVAPTCPADGFAADGTRCDGGDGSCMTGQCEPLGEGGEGGGEGGAGGHGGGAGAANGGTDPGGSDPGGSDPGGSDPGGSAGQAAAPEPSSTGDSGCSCRSSGRHDDAGGWLIVLAMTAWCRRRKETR